MSEAIKLDTRELDKILQTIKPEVQKVVAKSCFRVEGRAKQASPLKTGANRNSGYTVAPGHDTYSQAATAANSANPGAKVDEKVTPSNDTTGIVGFSMEYSLYLETGTSRMAARPYLVPAVESEEKKLVSDLKELFK